MRSFCVKWDSKLAKATLRSVIYLPVPYGAPWRPRSMASDGGRAPVVLLPLALQQVIYMSYVSWFYRTIGPSRTGHGNYGQNKEQIISPQIISPPDNITPR